MKSRILRKIALTMAILLLVETLAPSIALALTSGPSQPEFQGFQQIGTSDMVDLFTGDFSHNIPLCEVGGYPLNLVYNSNPKMDDEASWVGLGWSLNPGAINRQMRGFPDDFKGDVVRKEFNMDTIRNYGFSFGPGVELFGLGGTLAKGVNYNSRRGFELELGINFNAGVTIGKSNVSIGGDIGLSFAPSKGLDISLKAGLPLEINDKIKIQNDISSGFNSRNGLRTFSFQNENILSMKSNKGTFSKAWITGLSFTPGPFSYTPTSPLPLANRSSMFRATLGGETFGSHPHIKIDGYSNIQYLEKKETKQLAFGYLHLAEGKQNEAAHLDYNTELNGQFKVNTPHIPLSYGTPDIFSIAGHGIGGQFRATRNDVGIFRPALSVNTAVSGSLGVEVGGGAYVHLGKNETKTLSNTSKQEWSNLDNGVVDDLVFSSNGDFGEDYEDVYFKTTGEQSLLPEGTEDLFTAINQTTPIRIDNQGFGGFDGRIISLDNLIAAKNGKETTFDTGGKLKNRERVSRNQVISYLTVEEAKVAGLDKTIISYPMDQDQTYCPYGILLNCDDCRLPTGMSRDAAGTRPDHHLSELTVTNSNGSRYVYGLPVYNNKQRDVTFSIDAPNTATTDVNNKKYGLTRYEPRDNSVSNNKGQDHYFDATELPPYAHSFLLTGVLSPDYVDRSGDGITDDDAGSATKFNYYKHTIASGDFKWRIPIEKDTAKYHEGLKASNKDDKASYFYGEKEIWYPHSIESRTMVARFYTSERFDALGVYGENGGADTSQSLLKLDSIGIFSKADLIENKEQAVPIKYIHFEYDYSLCTGVPNNLGKTTAKHPTNQGGKLTLKKVYFTYGKNRSGALNAYKFRYKTNDDSGTPLRYNIGHYDRWGCYQINPSTENLPNHEFPYVLQEGGYTEKTAGAWNLTEMDLPSGSKIKIDYEPDDYAYVQEVRAGQMLEVLGFRNVPEDGSDNEPSKFFKKKTIGFDNKRYVEVRLPKDVASIEEARKRYLEGIEDIYFNCLVQLDDDRANSYERVEGYFTLGSEELQIKKSNPTLSKYDRLWIPVSYLKDDRGRDIHPIAYAAVQKTRIDYPEFIYPGFDEDAPLTALFKTLVGFGREIGNLLKGFTNNSLRRGYGRSIKTGLPFSSWIRLNNPNFKKLGGGSRVRQLTINDEWTKNGSSSIYGQEYKYDMPITINGQTEMVSSGVACYEPAIGGEENSKRTPLPYEEKYKLAPKSLYYSENPIGESLFPAPMVGYSRVTVKDIANFTENLFRNKSGYTIHEFYTAKDFPTIVKHTEINPATAKSNPILRFLKVRSIDRRSVSQGFVIELNDMHGKQKMQSIYDKNASLLSSTKYNYKIEDGNAVKKKLYNEVSILQPDNAVESGTIGLSMDTWVEMLEENNETTTSGRAKNLDVVPFSIPIPPFSIPIPIFKTHGINNYENTQFKAATITKLVQRSGILDNVVVMENGSTIKTTNELYDATTGSVLLTKTQNEFDDAQYQFNYPAHWIYEGMGQAYQNIGGPFKILPTVPTPTNVIPADYKQYFYPGDEVVIERVGGSGPSFDLRKYFIQQRRIGSSFGEELEIVDEVCDKFQWNSANHLLIKVVRSGRRNLLNTSVGSIVSRQSPIVNGQLVLNQETETLSANAMTFSDDWKMQCKTDPSPDARAKQDCFGVEPIDYLWGYNPYIEGRKGNWRPLESYVLHETRNPDALAVSSTMNIRKKGIIQNFESFWEYNSGWEQAAINSNKWIKSDSIGLFDFRGNELERFDAIGVPSAANYGYNRMLATAVVQNAEYREIVFDGFEDYNFKTECSGSAATTAKDIAFRRNLDFIADINFNASLAIDINRLSDTPEFTEASSGIAHTGKHALIVEEVSEFFTYLKKLDPICPPTTTQTRLTDDVPKVFCTDCQTTLKPYLGKEYTVAAWMATDSSLTCGVPPRDYGIKVGFIDTSCVEMKSSIVIMKPSGPIIEGWQQIEGKVKVPSDALYLYLVFTPTLPISNRSQLPVRAYFDDFRFHPWRASNMQSYVYDPVSERLMATLDENNYASFYEYNDEGILVRTKRETEKGIITIQEGRMILKPNNID